MNADGKDCYPTTKRIAEETGLSERSVCTHLKKATETGWLFAFRKGDSGQAWSRHQYRPNVPKGTEPPSAPLAEGTEPHDIKALNVVQSSSSVSSSIPSRAIPKKNGSYPVEFETIWSLYPKRTGANSKRAAFRAWQARLKAGVPQEEILNGVRRYAGYCDDRGNAGTSYVKMAATFLGPDEWWKEPWNSTDDNGRPDLAVL